MACGMVGAIAAKHSSAALREPGRLIINVLFRMPHTALKHIESINFKEIIEQIKTLMRLYRESTASGVIFRLDMSIAVDNPEASL